MNLSPFSRFWQYQKIEAVRHAALRRPETMKMSGLAHSPWER